MSSNDNGNSRRENLERKLEDARRRKNIARIKELKDELTLPDFPRELGYLWRAYHRLRKRTGDGFASANPVSWRDIEAFMNVTRFRFAPWEVELIETIDDAFRSPQLVALKSKAKPGAAPTELIDSSDTKSVRNLMRSIGKRRSGKGGVPSQT